MVCDADSGDRYILCRPRNGLNDTISAIGKCWQHAETFDRILVIDTIRSAIFTDISLFFSPLSPSSRIVMKALPSHIEALNTLPCQPNVLKGRLSTYVGEGLRIGDRNVFCDTQSKLPLQLDMTQDYSESLVVFESGFGGIEGIEFLKRVKLESELARELSSQIRQLGPNYVAVHIRHSDYKTDWRKFLKTIRAELRGRTVLICSDSAQVVRAAPFLLKDSIVRTVSDLPYTDGRPQHLRGNVGEDQRTATARSALIDLFALGAASDLYVTSLSSRWISGYSQLASSICADRTILNSLLGEDLFDQHSAAGKIHHILFGKRWIFRIQMRLLNIYENQLRSLNAFGKVCLRALGRRT